ncbi:MAG: sigma-B regulation protein RsbU (phosphoserine phosphatase), partial [Planctomycetota bacterium]
GDLSHRTEETGGGEVELLARSIDRMTSDLEGAQEAELQLSMREREMEVAGGVREALLPMTTPLLEGYDIGGTHISAPDGIGGDFHDFIELPDGRVGLLVCDVSGQGVPAALVGATARSYLRTELARGGDPVKAFQLVNKWLSDDVRRGMYVTALYALVDGREGVASVLCAGHKVPLMRYTAEDSKLRVVHPEGIALGFDRGPVFDRRLEQQHVPLLPGDRLLLANSAPLRIENEEGVELGEKGFFQRVLLHSKEDTAVFLRSLKRDLATYAAEGSVPFDVSLVTLSRAEQS